VLRKFGTSCPTNVFYDDRFERVARFFRRVWLLRARAVRKGERDYGARGDASNNS
jgi:hypothetical protein